MSKYIIKNGKIVNRGKIQEGDLLIVEDKIAKIDGIISTNGAREIDAKGCFVIPGIIDDQVHFREPGLVHKANIYTEARAAVAGGTTSFMEMPNTKPAALTIDLLENKYEIARKFSLSNYSFFMGASNDNIEEVLKTDGKNICGVKIFMGSSTGNMLVDNEQTLNNIFSKLPLLIATHCEDEETIRNNFKEYVDKYGDQIPISAHPLIRNVEGCYKSSSLAIELAKKHNSRLHILHISTKDELDLFDNSIPLKDKKITSEVCVHHLYFNASQYDQLGTKMKCNPAIKAKEHQEALLPALLDDRLDIIATDHAPHTMEEKNNLYGSAPSGLPLVQHSLNVMLSFYHKGLISIEKIVEKMCHAPAICFQINDRGYLDEGMKADVVIVDPEANYLVAKDNIYYKCGWSPLEGTNFKGKVLSTFVSGHLVYNNGVFDESKRGERLTFNR